MKISSFIFIIIIDGTHLEARKKKVQEQNRKYLSGYITVRRSAYVMCCKYGKQNTKGPFNSHEIPNPSCTTFGADLFELRWQENFLLLFFVGFLFSFLLFLIKLLLKPCE